MTSHQVLSPISLTKALGSPHPVCPLPHSVPAVLGEGDRMVVLVWCGWCVEPAAPVSGLHWEATPPDCTRGRLPASRGKEGGRPPTGVPTPTHHHPIRPQHHLPNPNQPRPTKTNTIPTSHCQFPNRRKPTTKTSPKRNFQAATEQSVDWPKHKTKIWSLHRPCPYMISETGPISCIA